MPAYFISDQHLKDPSEERCQALLLFFRTIRSRQQCSDLFLVGDIFDLWAGSHDYFVQKWQVFNRELLRLVTLGVRVHYFEGNHDLLFSDYFYKQLGVLTYDGPAYFQIEGKTVRVEHGDQMDPEDRGYLILRKFWRSFPVRVFNRNAPGTWIAKFGDWASRQSRKHNQAEPNSAAANRIRALTDAHVQRAYQERPFDIFVAGHFHLLDDREIPIAGKSLSVRAINLGFQECPLQISGDTGATSGA